jgi:hypothetical protein
MRTAHGLGLFALTASLPFVLAVACSSSGSTTAESGPPASGQGGAAGSGGGGQPGPGGAAGASAGTSGAAGGEAGGTGQPGGAAGAAAAGASGAGGSAAGEAGNAGAGQPGGAGGEGGTAGSGGSGGSGGAAAAGSGGAAAGSGGEAGSAAAGAGGDGGAAGGDAGPGWPTCDSQPEGSVKTSISQVWTDNPADYAPVWIEGVSITAVSFGACNPSGNFECQIFLQTAPTYGSLQEGKHQGIKLFVSQKASSHFAGLGLGDVVNLYGNAIRYTSSGYNELRIHVDLEHPGCAKKVGSSSPSPIGGVALVDLTSDAYENSIGPLLVKIDTLKGKPAATATETFAVYPDPGDGGTFDGGSFDAGLDETEVLTPYYMPGGSFPALPADQWTPFASITGVFSNYLRFDAGQTVKYRTLGPRASSDIVVQK